MNQTPLLHEAHLVFRHHHWLFEEVFRRLSQIFKTQGAHRLAGAHRPGALYSRTVRLIILHVADLVKRISC